MHGRCPGNMASRRQELAPDIVLTSPGFAPRSFKEGQLHVEWAKGRTGHAQGMVAPELSTVILRRQPSSIVAWV